MSSTKTIVTTMQPEHCRNKQTLVNIVGYARVQLRKSSIIHAAQAQHHLIACLCSSVSRHSLYYPIIAPAPTALGEVTWL
jgi:hypothetical protein